VPSDRLGELGGKAVWGEHPYVAGAHGHWAVGQLAGEHGDGADVGTGGPVFVEAVGGPAGPGCGDLDFLFGGVRASVEGGEEEPSAVGEVFGDAAVQSGAARPVQQRDRGGAEDDDGVAAGEPAG